MRTRAATLVMMTLAMGIDAGASTNPEAGRIELDSRPTKVTAYQGRAWVERSVSIDLEAGLHRLVFRDLPHRWQSESVQGRVSGNAKVVGIDTMSNQISNAPKNMTELIEAVKQAAGAVQHAKDSLAVTDASIDYLQSMMSKASSGEQRNAGTASLDIASVQQQMEFFSQQLRSLLQTRMDEARSVEDRQRELEVAESKLSRAGGSSRTERTAEVELVVSESGVVEVTLGYLVTKANWSPRYDVRGDLEGESVRIEYGAEVQQQSGEDWTDVTLVLSTAQPSRAANPPTLEPVYVNVLDPSYGMEHDSLVIGNGMVPPPAAMGAGRGGGERSLAKDMEYASDAQIRSGGSSVTFTLPRRMTVETNSKSAQRTRIAEFESDVDFTFVAMPVLTEQVYLRGRFTNASDYQLLPGRGGIFMGGDYVGPTDLASTAPGADMELFFGADPALTASETMLTRSTGSSGVFGGWVRTDSSYVIKVDNGSGRPVKMELWDRRPVSRSDEIDVAVVGIDPALSTDAVYLADDAPRGLMRWDITVPAGRTGEDAFTLSYDLRVEHKEGVVITPLPE